MKLKFTKLQKPLVWSLIVQNVELGEAGAGSEGNRRGRKNTGKEGCERGPYRPLSPTVDCEPT